MAARFEGWQATIAWERTIKYALHRALLNYKLYEDVDLFDQVYAYSRHYS